MDYEDIARDAYEKVAVGPGRKTNYDFEEPSEEGLIAAAQAVRAAVIEECAIVADGELDIGNTVSAAIRALKGKR